MCADGSKRESGIALWEKSGGFLNLARSLEDCICTCTQSFQDLQRVLHLYIGRLNDRLESRALMLKCMERQVGKHTVDKRTNLFI